MLVVVAILSVAAAITVSQASAVTPYVADAVATEVARAIRFAQREGMRTGIVHVAEIDPGKQTVRVYRLTDRAPYVEDIQPVMYPADEQPYRISLMNNPAMRATIASSDFVYGANRSGDIAFGSDGTPINVNYIKGAAATASLSTDGVVRVESGAAVRTVTVDKTTGRVTP